MRPFGGTQCHILCTCLICIFLVIILYVKELYFLCGCIRREQNNLMNMHMFIYLAAVYNVSLPSDCSLQLRTALNALMMQ